MRYLGVFVPGLFLAASTAAAQTPPRGDMDALLGPATAVNQGTGMTDEIRRALAPGPEHELLARLLGSWRVEGIAGRNQDSVVQRAEVTSLFEGGWYEMRLFSNDQLVRQAQLGFDGYRGSYAMWEIGRGFTSPQARVGESRAERRELHFWRTYTIRRRGEHVRIRERVVLTFLADDRLRWQSFESIDDEPERTQRDVIFTLAE